MVGALFFQYELSFCFDQCRTNNLFRCYVAGSTDQESSQQLRTWFSEHFFAPKLVAWFALSLVRFLLQRYKYGAKKCPKNHVRFDFEFSQSENRKNNRKTFEGASVEPTNEKIVNKLIGSVTRCNCLPRLERIIDDYAKDGGSEVV